MEQHHIFDYLRDSRGVDVSAYHPAFLEQQLQCRMQETNCVTPADYLACLQQQPDEIRRRLDALFISYTTFFRDPLTFELLNDRILPQLFRSNNQARRDTIRIWSDG